MHQREPKYSRRDTTERRISDATAHNEIVIYPCSDTMAGMGEVSLDMIWKRLADVQAGQQATDAKIGTLAEGMVSMRKRIDDIA
jgi:hypothetical protein